MGRSDPYWGQGPEYDKCIDEEGREPFPTDVETPGLECSGELELPAFLNRKVNGYVPEPLPANTSWKLKNPNKIIWPRKQIERVMRIKARLERKRRKEAKKHG